MSGLRVINSSIDIMVKNVNILGYKTSSAGLLGDVEAAWGLIKNYTTSKYVTCANPHSLVVACTDKAFSKSLDAADILLPDGIGIVIAARILGVDLTERVAGSEFFLELTKKANENSGLRYFFCGSSEDVLEKISARLNREFPNITVCGVLSPPFKEEFTDEDNKKMVEKINKAKPDVLWVGMTAPKQEKWIHQNLNQLNVPLSAAIGAVFDFYAGTKKRSPQWVCKLGLEWLPRLLREPRRLFRRNFISTPVFLYMVLKERFRKI